MSSKFVGQFFKLHSGRESYEIYYAESPLIFPIATMLEEKFDLSTDGLPLFGLDGNYLSLKREEGSLSIILGWDNWSGVFIMAENEHSDDIVREIGKHLNSILPKLERMNEELLVEDRK